MADSSEDAYRFADFFPIPCTGEKDRKLQQRYQKKFDEAKSLRGQAALARPANDADAHKLLSDLLESSFTDDGIVYDGVYRFVQSLLSYEISRGKIRASLQSVNAGSTLAAFIDYCFSWLYLCNAIFIQRKSPVSCPRCGAKLFAFTNYCPNHPWVNRRCPTITDSYNAWTKKHALKPASAIIGGLGVKVGHAILDFIVRPEFLVLEALESNNAVVETDFVVVEMKAARPLALMLEAKLHPAVSLPAFVSGTGPSTSNKWALKLPSATLSLSELSKALLGYGFDKFRTLWQGLWELAPDFKELRGMRFGIGSDVDDSKNQPGIERSDDMKKGLAQVMMYSLLRSQCQSFDIRSGLMSNVYPTSERGTLLELLAKRELVSGTQKWPVISAVIGFTKNIFTEQDVRSIFN